MMGIYVMCYPKRIFGNYANYVIGMVLKYDNRNIVNYFDYDVFWFVDLFTY